MSKKKPSDSSQRQRRRVRVRQILFAIVAIVVITSFIISLVTKY